MASNLITATKEEYKVINDSVHGHIEIHPLCVKIMDTPEFQRLRNIKQLGTTYLVYPGASHNRFEHSLGVCYLAGEMIDVLRKNQSSLRITEKVKLCVQIAGLCHDLGHGPFSNLWEHFLRIKDIEWNHEDQSVIMFNHLLEKNSLFEEFERYGLDEGERKFITELMLGEGTSCDVQKQFLFQIVCNKTNSIDVDKWDYFLRDGLYLNLKVSFDYRRLLHFCKVIEKKENDGRKKMHIGFTNKESYNISEMFLSHSSLQYRAYQHRVALVINRMIIDALCAADEYFLLRIPIETLWDKTSIQGELVQGRKGKFADGTSYYGLKLSEAHGNPEFWTRLTDNIFYDIVWNHLTNLAPAQKILNRILNRRLYKFIYSKKVFPPKDFKSKQSTWPDELTNNLEKMINIKFKGDHMQLEYAVVSSSFFFGSSVPDPFKSVYFYDKINSRAVENKDWSEIALFPATKTFEPAYHLEIFIICKDPDITDMVMNEVKEWSDVFIESFFN